jgi:hypothetical protein
VVNGEFTRLAEAVSADTLTNNRGWRVEARPLSYECIVRDLPRKCEDI